MFLPYSRNCHTSRYYARTGKRVLSTTLDEREAIRVVETAERLGISVAELIRQAVAHVSLKGELVTAGQ